MPVTLIVRSGAGEAAKGARRPPGRSLTLDGSRIVLGRGAGSDLRLPDASVSLRHATIRAQDGSFVLVDEGSTNGTFVGKTRLSPQTPRPLKSTDRVRLGRVWIEVRLEPAATTPDPAVATRDLAMALVAEALEGLGHEVVPTVRVVEGRDAGLAVPLHEEGRVYVVGRGEECDVALNDADASREHAHLVRRGATVLLRDLGSKNGVVTESGRLPIDRDVPWPPGAPVRVGRSTLVLEEPVAAALAELEDADDERVEDLDAADVLDEAGDEAATDAPANDVDGVIPPPDDGTPPRGPLPTREAGEWDGPDLAVLLAAAVILLLSLGGLLWLLRGG